jgi:hypothetical protein
MRGRNEQGDREPVPDLGWGHAGPGDPQEDRREGFPHGGWQLPYLDEAAGSAIAQGIAASGGLLLGRRTYELFAAFWPNQPADDPSLPR